MLHGFGKLFQREWRHIWHNKRILVIMLLVPALFSFLCGSIYSSKTLLHLPVGVVNYSPSTASRTLINAFDQSPVFEVSQYYGHESEISDAMMRGDICGVIIIPPEFSRDLQRGQQAQVLLGANGTNMSISSTIISKGSEIISTYSTQIAVKTLVAGGETRDGALDSMLPVSFYLRAWYNPTVNFSNFLVPGYLTVMAQLTSIYFAAIAVVWEKRAGTWSDIRRITASPLALVAAKQLPYLILGLVSWFMAFAILIYGFDTPMVGSWLVWLALSVVFFFCFTSIALLISSLTKSAMEATQAAMIVALPAFLLSGYTWPFTAMPPLCALIGHLFPLTYFATNVRNIALMGAGLNDVALDMLILLAIGTAAWLLAVLANKRALSQDAGRDPERPENQASGTAL